MIAGSDASALTPVINAAADANIPVVCFNSDAPKSKRIAFYGVDDEAMGRLIMQELAKAMSDTGTIAILAGNEKAPNLQARLKGLREELKRHPNIHEIRGDGAFYCVETPQDGVTAMNAATVANPGIDGWALLGGWPLFTDQAFAALPPTIKCISADAMPKQFQYVSGGQVQELIAQDCYGWGYNSTEILLDRILNGPQPVRTFAARLTIVSKDNLDDYGKLWERMVQPMNRDLPLPDNRVSPVKVDDDPMKSIRERLHLQDSQ
jgi:ribose transport system substrate-binding protein